MDREDTDIEEAVTYQLRSRGAEPRSNTMCELVNTQAKRIQDIQKTRNKTSNTNTYKQTSASGLVLHTNNYKTFKESTCILWSSTRSQLQTSSVKGILIRIQSMKWMSSMDYEAIRDALKRIDNKGRHDGSLEAKCATERSCGD